MAYLKTVCSVALKMLLKWDKVSAKEELVGEKKNDLQQMTVSEYRY